MTPDEPARAPHPTIYHVVLSPNAALTFQASQAARTTALTGWRDKARALGKRSVVVMGPLCELARVDVKEE